jgi:hypothetical protein
VKIPSTPASIALFIKSLGTLLQRELKGGESILRGFR